MANSTDEKISLRPAGPEDLPALAAIAGKIFWETFTGMMPEEDLQAYILTAFSKDQFQSEWTSPSNTFLLAFCGREWAGYAKISTSRRVERPEPEKYLEIERLYVLRKYHGRKIGAGLMYSCIRYALDNGVQTVWLNVWERNIQAIEFYQRWNFEFVDSSISMRGNDPQKALWMKKKLIS
jgi:diamine N-acetyltransferase